MSAIKGKPNYKTRTGYNTSCDHCNKEIYVSKVRYENSKNHFCNMDCANKYQGRNKLNLICKTCGKHFFRSPSWKRDRSGYYCSIDCRNKSDEWRENALIKGNIIQQQNKGLNKLELLGNKILDEIGVEYITQKIMFHKFNVDVFLPKYNIIIQWDGDYWHGYDMDYNKLDHRQKKRYNLDISQDAYFKEAGIKVLRFWEHQVYNERNDVIENIKRAIQ